MRRAIFRKSFKRIANKLFFVFAPVVVVLLAVGHSQSRVPEDMRVSYFVSPEYPRVARQLMQSGDVALTVTVDTSGRPTEIVVKTPHVLLGESAKQTVSKWLFVPPSSTSRKHVFFHYGFSGTPRDCNPSTIVTVDLQAPRVTVTVDPLPPFGPDAFPASTNPAKRQ